MVVCTAVMYGESEAPMVSVRDPVCILTYPGGGGRGMLAPQRFDLPPSLVLS